MRHIPNALVLNLLTLYLTFSVINWLPIISTGLIRGIKYILFIIILSYEFKYFKFRYPSLYLSPIGLILIIISMVVGLGLAFSYPSIVDIVLPFVVIWIFNFPKEYYYRCIL